MTTVKDFIVRIENPAGYSGGFVYSPGQDSELLYVLAARHSLVSADEVPWTSQELSIEFLIENKWSKYNLQTDDIILFGKNNEHEDIGVLGIKKSSLPVILDYSICPSLCIVPEKDHHLEITGYPKVVQNELKRTLYQLKTLNDKDYNNQIQIEVSDPLTGEYNDENLVEGYSGSPIFIKVKNTLFCCGLFLGYEKKNKRILAINLNLINELLLSKSLKTLSLLEIETDEAILDAIEKLNENSMRVLSRVRSSVGNVKLPRTKISAEAAEVIQNNRLAIFTGKPGAGKSALIKNVFENLKGKYEVLALQGEQLDRENIEQLFSEPPFSFKTKFADVLNSPTYGKRKILLIDSIEKVLETSNADTILDFFELLSMRDDITLILTCRSYAVEQLKIRFLRHFPPFPNFEVPLLDKTELNTVADSYPALVSLLENISLSKVLQIPFNLDKAVTLPEKSINIDVDSEAKFKQIMWEYVIEGLDKITDADLRKLRGDIFMKIALQRTAAMSAYATVDDAPQKILYSLIADNIIDPEPVHKNSFAPAHDIYEDWALTRHIDSNFGKHITDQGNYNNFYKDLGCTPAIRRAFRIWISEKIQTINEQINHFLKATLKEQKIQKYWKDEILIAIMQSPYSGDFLKENKDFLFLNNFEYFKRINFLVQVACQKPDFTLLSDVEQEKRIELYHNINLIPFGEGWHNLIEFIFLNLNVLQTEMRLILLTLLQWEKGFKKEHPFPAEAVYVGKILVWYYNLFTSTVTPDLKRSKTDDLNNGILLLFSLADVVKEDLKAIIENAFRNKKSAPDYAIGNLYDKIISYVLDGYESKEICKNYPDLVLEIAEKRWFYYPPTPEEIAEMSKKSLFGAHFRSGIHSENDFGIQESTSRDYSPASPYETPLLNLLLVSPFKTLNFLIKLFNHAASAYVNSDFGKKNQFLFPADVRSEITIIMPDGIKIKQHASPTLWMMFRGTYVSVPDLLQASLMALECYLLYIGKDIKENPEGEYAKFLQLVWDYSFDILIRESNNVMADAILISVANEHMALVGNKIFPLLKIKEIYKLDFNRCINEAQAFSPISYKKHSRLRHLQLQNFQNLKHRSKSIEDLVMNLSLGQYEADIFQIIDKFNSENPRDQAWRFALTRIDKRKYKIVGEVENGILMQTELEEDLKQVVEQNKETQAISHPVSHAALWSMNKLRNETVEDDNYGKWSEFYMISQAAENNENIASRYKQPALLAAIGIRDFYSCMTAAEKEWSTAKVIELFKYELFENRQQLDYQDSKYTVFETEAAFSVIPLILSNAENSEKKELRQYIVFALINLTDKSEYRSLIESIRHNLWQSDPDFVLLCISSIIEYSKISFLKRNLQYFRRDETSSKKSLFLFLREIYYKIKLMINSSYTGPGHYSNDKNYDKILLEYNSAINKIMDKVAAGEAPLQIEFPDYEKNGSDWLFEALKLVPPDTNLKILHDYHKEVLNFIFENLTRDSESFDDRLHYSLQQLFHQKFAQFLLNQPENIAIEHFKMLIDWAYREGSRRTYGNKKYDFVEKCLEELINQLTNDESKSYNFWILWNYLSHKILTTKTFIFDKTLLLDHRILSLSQKEWAPLESKKDFFETVILEGGDLNSSGRLIAGIGYKELMPDGIIWLAERIKNEWPDNEDWNFYIEKIVIKTYYDGIRRKEVTLSATLRNAFISLLDKLIDESASSTAYIIRDDFISSKGLIE
ncbi:ATP-binding protein [Flavobacterium cupreum]|uniref:ATP-binding protein n=3 Tax=Flavobacterium TaxID=237 RepID=A0A434A2C2_9FLAO|nr:ATP-binding protein [Flavobacterium cupreum]RUT68528.1 ATP-binding protein [Flavobacterium cupreum]